MKKIIAFFFVTVMLLTVCCLPVSAEPNDSFMHVEGRKGSFASVTSREMFTATKRISASELGFERQISGLSDLCCDKNGNIYMLASDRSYIVILNADYSLKKKISLIDDTGFEVNFEGAQGIFVDDNDNIYVADTKNSRVLISDLDGKINKVWETPESSLIPKDFYYQPVRVLIDKNGYVYILSLGCYYGALIYSPDGEFMGFYGSNTVKTGALDTLSYIWDMITKNDSKKSVSVKKLPYSFVDFSIGPDGYMVTCTGKTETNENSTGQIRKINAGGYDILYKRDTSGSSRTSESVNFVENRIIDILGQKQIQNIISVDVDESGFIYALDSTFNLIYVYDSECNMLSGFGGGGKRVDRLGVFETPVSLKTCGDSLLVIDSANGSLTVFELTEYGKALKDAQLTYNRGDYELAKSLWEKVLSYDRGNLLAYRGLAMAAYGEGDYETALKYAEIGLDYTAYDMAHQSLIEEEVSSNFIWIFIVGFLVIAAVVVCVVILKKRKIVLIKNTKIRTALAVPIHPFNSLGEIKDKNQGSLIFAIILTVLLFVMSVLQQTMSGFLFRDDNVRTYNSLFTLLGTSGLLLLWVVANWLFCSLFAGKGTLKEVFIVSAYSMMPMISFIAVRIVLSHFISLSGLSFLNGLNVFVMIFTFFILSVAIMTVHEYDFFKFLLTSIGTVCLMILIVFVMFLIGVLLQQIAQFFDSIFTEITYR